MCHQWRASETRCGVHKLSRDCSEGRRISQRRIRLRPVATIWPCVKVTSSQVLNLPALRPTSIVAKHSWPTQGKLRYDICFPIIPRKNKTWKQGGESKRNIRLHVSIAWPWHCARSALEKSFLQMRVCRRCFQHVEQRQCCPMHLPE